MSDIIKVALNNPKENIQDNVFKFQNGMLPFFSYPRLHSLPFTLYMILFDYIILITT